jgi:hypothetical protein
VNWEESECALAKVPLAKLYQCSNFMGSNCCSFLESRGVKQGFPIFSIEREREREGLMLSVLCVQSDIVRHHGDMSVCCSQSSCDFHMRFGMELPRCIRSKWYVVLAFVLLV